MDIVLGIWGKVLAAKNADTGVVAVKVVENTGGGYLVFTQEGNEEFDVWVEDLDEAREFLEEFDIDWSGADS